jgi:hypothetical protein
MDSSVPTTPITPTSPSSDSSYFHTPPSSPSESSPQPQVPLHIIVTFEGRVREMLRISREEGEVSPTEERRSRRTTRPRYYAATSMEDVRPVID